jgi:hypothetical protein
MATKDTTRKGWRERGVGLSLVIDSVAGRLLRGRGRRVWVGMCERMGRWTGLPKAQRW